MALAMQLRAASSSGPASVSPFHGFSFLPRDEETERAVAWLKAHQLDPGAADVKRPGTLQPRFGAMHPPGLERVMRSDIKAPSFNDQIEAFRRLFRMQPPNGSSE